METEEKQGRKEMGRENDALRVGFPLSSFYLPPLFSVSSVSLC